MVGEQEPSWAGEPTPGDFWDMDGWVYNRIPKAVP